MSNTLCITVQHCDVRCHMAQVREYGKQRIRETPPNLNKRTMEQDYTDVLAEYFVYIVYILMT
eukprot:3722884-Amphidinium_carterae.1